MADIKIVCEGCGTENTFSEYSKPESRLCSNCSAPLLNSAASGRKKLRIRDMSSEESKNTTLRGTPLHPEQEEHEEQAKSSGGKKRRRRRTRAPSSLLLGFILFLLVGGLLVGAQYCIESGTKVADIDIPGIYSWLRILFIAVAAILVVIDAFRDGQFTGFLALLFPPYLIFYALAKMDSFWRQGLFIAVMVALGMELHFMKEDAIITHCDNFIQERIDFVSDSFERVRE